MRYAVISDIHSNLEALLAVLNEIDSRGADEIICLGDVVGYNANPNECVEIIKGRGIKCVMGNHDLRASGIEEPDDFTYLAREAILWTRRQLKDENLAFLKTLPRRLSFPDANILAFHGSMRSTDEYILSIHDAALNFMLMQKEGTVLSFFGHTHVRIAYKQRFRDISIEDGIELKVEGNARYLVNPGSIGQPRDGDPRAAFLMYDADAKMANFVRVEYDIDKCYKKILEAGLQVELAMRLRVGR